jgi:ABC-type sugar transport systems, permease components
MSSSRNKSLARATHPAWTPWFFLAPFLAITAIFVVWPLGGSLVLSFQQTFGPEATKVVGWDNFKFLLRDPLFWKAVRNTTLYATGSVLLQLPLALLLALALNHPRLRGRTLFRLLFFLPSLVGLIFAGVVFSLVLETRTGLLNHSLHALIPAFDPEFPWLSRYPMAALLLSALWLYVGFNMIYFLAALQSVPRDLLEAASIDGASAWQRFRHVILPEITPVTHFVVLLSLVGSFQMFELSWVLFNNTTGPNDGGLTIVMYLYRTGFIVGDLGYASAVGWVLALLLISFSWLQRRLRVRSAEGGVA